MKDNTQRYCNVDDKDGKWAWDELMRLESSCLEG